MHYSGYRLQPWNCATSIACFEHLAKSNGVSVEEGVAQAVYDKIGIGIPHHVQSFFARLSDFLGMHGRSTMMIADVEEVYNKELLGPSGQSDLAHYETRLKDAFDEDGYSIAMKILAEAAVHQVFTATARKNLEQLYAPIMENIHECVADAINILEHDGYLIAGEGGHRFPSCLLQDWWAIRFRDHHNPLDSSHIVDESRK